jgi:hypothetical protein
MEMTLEQQRAVAMVNARLRMNTPEPEVAPPDKYQQAALDERAKLAEKGISIDAGLPRLALQGATFNTGDEILAGMMTIPEMIKRGTWDPREGYNYAKAREDLALSEGRKSAGWAGTAADVGGGILTGSTLARGGLTAARALAPNAGLGARSLASAADAGIMGAVAGGAEGNTLEERGSNALKGGAIGAGAGLATPGVLQVAGALASPITSNIRARVNPEGYARSQVARAMMESSQTPRQIADDVAMAAREGQGVYTVADAMGNPGQRMLSSTTRAPGPGRTDTVEFLDQRQAGQGRRISNALAEGFDSPRTAAQTREGLTAQRGNEANVNYGQARQDAGAVNVTPAIEAIDNTLQPGVTRVLTPQTNIADNSVEGALRRARSYLTDGRSQISGFDDALMAKRELDAMIDSANPTVQRTLIPVRNALDDQLAASSQSYRNARDTFRRQSQAIEAVDTGRDASMRGRTEDTIPAFQGMRPDQQAAYRAGYVDPLIADVQKAAFGANKARPLTNDAFRAESAVMAPGNDLMHRRLGRETTMFETRNQAMGGSKTADNLADQGALRESPSFVARLGSAGLTGNLRNVISVGSNMLTGNTPEVRAEVARILTMRGGNVTPQQMQSILEQAVNRVRAVQQIAAALGRGAAGGVAAAPATQR